MAKYLRGGLAAWLVLLAACGGEQLTSPPNELSTKPSLDSTRLTAPSSPLLTVTRSNLNVCSEGAPLRAANGRVKSWARESRRVNVRSAARDTTIAEYHAIAFSDDGKQLVDVQCVFARGDSAAAFIREYFSRTAYHPNGGGVGEGQDFLILPPNLYCSSGSGPAIDCYFFGNHVVCTPTVVAEQMRLGFDEVSEKIGRPLSAASLVDDGGYNCAFVVDPPSSGGSGPTSSNAGTISYAPPDGSPPTGFGGGVLPGGEYYYTPPTNTNCFLGGCSTSGGGPCYATLRRPSRIGASFALDCIAPDWTDGGDGEPAFYDPLPSSTADGLTWSRAAHDRFIDHAFGLNGCPAVNGLLKAVSLEEDVNYDGAFDLAETVRHALRPIGSSLSRQQVSLEIDAWITNRLTTARSEAQVGHWRAAMVALGQALHTIADRQSPIHTGADGLPNDAPDGLIEAWKGNHSMFDFVGGEGTAAMEPVESAVVTQFVSAMRSTTQGLQKPSCASYPWATGP